MSAHPSQSPIPELTPSFETEVGALERTRIHGSFFQAVRKVGEESNYTRRIDNLGLLLRDLDTVESTHFLMAAAKLSLTGEITGLRTFFAALNVRRSGVEVLKRLQLMTSIERTSLRLLSGTWKETPESDQENPAYAIMDMLQEAAAQGLLSEELKHWPDSPEGTRQTLEVLRRWLAWMTLKLASRQEIPKPAMDLITQICLLEISLTERRVSQLAEHIDPYDMQAMARMMPLLGRYDQNIEVWKQVISEVHTYVPFSEVMLTLEAMITDTEMGRIQKALFKQPGGRVVGLLFQRLRGNPILDRELLCLTSVMYQAVNLCSLNHPKDYPPVDLLSVCLGAVDAYRDGTLPPLVLDPHAMESTWPVLDTWGMWKNTPVGLVYTYNENRSIEFIHPDGTPVLDPIPGFHQTRTLSIEDLLLTQLSNDAFILGLLDNPKALQRPTVVPTIAMMCRSVRVLLKIANTRTLHTGANNKDVPRLLLMNPARIPIATLRRFIHVRFVSRTDLERLGRSNSDVRQEVRQEVQRYLSALKSGA